MYLLREFITGKFAKRTRKHPFPGYFRGPLPAAQTAQSGVVGQAVEQRPRVRDIKTRLGQKGARHACAIMSWPAAAPPADHEAIQLQQRQSPYESLMAITQWSQLLRQDGEELALENPRKSAEESGYAIHGGR